MLGLWVVSKKRDGNGSNKTRFIGLIRSNLSHFWELRISISKWIQRSQINEHINNNNNKPQHNTKTKNSQADKYT